MKTTIPFLCFALASTSVVTAQGTSLEASVKKAVEKASAATQDVKATDVEKRLKLRTPKFRKVKLFDAKDLPKPETPPAKIADPGMQKPKVRLFGDAEKTKLGAGVVATIDGAAITEAEVMDLASYLAKSGGGDVESKIPAAFDELLTIRVIEAGMDKAELTKLKKQIADLHSEAKAADADFAAIAREHSHCPSGKQAGGALGQFGRASMVPSFARYAFTTAVGQLSPVFATRFGYHFLKVTGKQKGNTADTDQVSASHVLLMFDKTNQKAGALMARISSGTADIAMRDDAWRQKLPQKLR